LRKERGKWLKLPKLSIITVVKNHREGLQKTVASAISQTFPDWELLILDGSSTDGTLEIAESLSVIDSRVKIISRSDAGIYDAMNIGLMQAAGDFVWFMNAGDTFYNKEVTSHAVDKMHDTSFGLLIGGYEVKSSSGRRYNFREKALDARWLSFSRRGCCHQAMLFRATSLEASGPYDLSINLASDFDLVLRILKLAGGRRTSTVYASIEPNGVADQRIQEVLVQKHLVRCSIFNQRYIKSLSHLWTLAAQINQRLRNS
jgi:glycosyltransferase involved in cell wall biosynthesis